MGDPCGGGNLWIGVAGEVGLLAGPGVLDDGPGIAGEIGAMDNQSPDGSAAAGLFILVGPAAVVGQGLAGEEAGVIGGWVADDDEDDFSADVDAVVVIPFELGGVDSV